MAKKIDRIGETGRNNFGSEMIIVEYRGYHNIDVYFPEYDWTAKNTEYQNFKKGNIKCPYERRYYGVGYIGDEKCKASENRKHTRVYDTWKSMLQRCYSEKYHKKYPTYKDCTVCEELHNFQNFAKWYENNFYQVDDEKMCLDKDILVKHNKIYSPETCIFVPERINTLFIKCDKSRGNSVIGTSPTKNSKYVAQCWLIDPETGKSKRKHLGYYDTQEKAFQVYKYYKEKNIKEVADYYFGRIPDKLYDALYDYEVEIDD